MPEASHVYRKDRFDAGATPAGSNIRDGRFFYTHAKPPGFGADKN
jgi:hypothetical protein